MCSDCLNEHPSLCPPCRREIFRETGKFVDFKTLMIIFFGGAIGFGLFYFFLINQYPDTANEHLFPYSFIFFFLGISVIYTFYLYKDSDSFKSIGKEIPFIGYKLMFLWAILTAISLIPALLYLQKVVLFFITKKKRTI